MATKFFGAFSSFIAKSGVWSDLPSSFGYTINSEIALAHDSVFKIYDGRSNSDHKQTASIFVFELRDADGKPVSEYLQAFARNALKAIKSVRHPYILKPLATAEVPSGIYIATEPVKPLCIYGLSPDPSWMLCQLGGAIEFLNVKAKLAHGLVSPYAMYVTADGSQYRLGLFETCRPIGEWGSANNAGAMSPTLETHPLYTTRKFVPPENVRVSGYGLDVWGWVATASWAYAAIQRTVSTGYNTPVTHLESLGPNLDLSALPPKFKAACERLLVGAAKARSPYHFSKLIKDLPFFSENRMVQIISFLEEINLKSSWEKEQFFHSLPTALDEVSSVEAQALQILPLLRQQLALNPSLAGTIVCSIVQIAIRVAALYHSSTSMTNSQVDHVDNSGMLPVADVTEKLKTRLTQNQIKDIVAERIIPLIIELLHLQERTVRYLVLQHLDYFSDFIDSTHAENIIDDVCMGCLDSAALLREITLKSFCIIVPKLKKSASIEKVLRLMQKLGQQDPEGSIRTNSVICCAKLAPSWPEADRTKILIGTFIAAFRDSFTPCRLSALNCVLACSHLFNGEDIMKKLLASVGLRCCDPDPAVCDLAFKTLEALVERAKATLHPASRAALNDSSKSDAQGEIVGEELRGGSKSWANWAIRRALDFYGKPNTALSGNQSEVQPLTEALTGLEGSVAVASDSVHGERNDATGTTPSLNLSLLDPSSLNSGPSAKSDQNMAPSWATEEFFDPIENSPRSDSLENKGWDDTYVAEHETEKIQALSGAVESESKPSLMASKHDSDNWDAEDFGTIKIEPPPSKSPSATPLKSSASKPSAIRSAALYDANHFPALNSSAKELAGDSAARTGFGESGGGSAVEIPALGVNTGGLATTTFPAAGPLIKVQLPASNSIGTENRANPFNNGSGKLETDFWGDLPKMNEKKSRKPLILGTKTSRKATDL